MSPSIAAFSQLTTWVGVVCRAPENLWHERKAPVVKQLYRLNIEPRVIDQLTKLATRTGEPKTRLAARLFTER